MESRNQFLLSAPISAMDDCMQSYCYAKAYSKFLCFVTSSSTSDRLRNPTSPIAGLLPVFRCVYIRIPQEIAACLPICCPCISRLGFVRGQFGHLSCLASCHGQSAACKAAAAWIGSEIHHPRGQGIGASPAARCCGSVGASSSKANSSSSSTHPAAPQFASSASASVPA